MVRSALILLLSAAPAPALTLADLAGAWRGEGVYARGDDPAQRLRCQMRGVATANGVALSGRCATAQGGQSFAWDLSGSGAQVLAQDRSPRTDDAPAPPPSAGRIGADGLRFDTPGGGAFAVVRQGQVLVLTLSGQDQGQPLRAEARLEAAR